MPLGANSIFNVFNNNFTVEIGLNSTPQKTPIKLDIVLNPSADYEYTGKQEKLKNALAQKSANFKAA